MLSGVVSAVTRSLAKPIRTIAVLLKPYIDYGLGFNFQHL